jgi:hypothetical protein
MQPLAVVLALQNVNKQTQTMQWIEISSELFSGHFKNFKKCSSILTKLLKRHGTNSIKTNVIHLNISSTLF